MTYKVSTYIPHSALRLLVIVAYSLTYATYTKHVLLIAYAIFVAAKEQCMYRV